MKEWGFVYKEFKAVKQESYFSTTFWKQKSFQTETYYLRLCKLSVQMDKNVSTYRTAYNKSGFLTRKKDATKRQ
jgi:hypothetical protein